MSAEKENECLVVVEETKQPEEKFILCTKANLGLLACTLLLVGCAAAVLVMKNWNQGLSQADGHFEELRHSLRQTHVRAAIHLDGKYDEATGSVKWQKDTDQSYSRGEMRLEDNEIVVPLSGLYFVYSQASYSINCNAKEEEEEEEEENKSLVHISHTVERRTDSYGSGEELEQDYRPILHAVRTACHRHKHKGAWFSGVYVGAMFNLMRGDRLRTNLTQDAKILSQLEDQHGETFFGVFAL